MQTQPTSDAASDWCFLLRREEQAAALSQRYLRYVARFERRDNRRAWLRYIVGSPVTALSAIFKRKPLPLELRRQPLSEVDFQHELFLGSIRRMSATD